MAHGDSTSELVSSLREVAALSRPASAPALRAGARARPLSASSHPLTLRHNSRHVEISVVLPAHTVKGEARSLCHCVLCCTPSGPWRKDEVPAEVDSCLVALKSGAREARGHVGEAPPEKTKSAPSMVPREQLQRTTAEDFDLSSWKLDATRLSAVRPASALQRRHKVGFPPGLNRRPSAEVQAHQQEVANRRLVADSGLVERRRREWDAKMAASASRQMLRAASAAALHAEAKAAVETVCPDTQKRRAQTWLRILHVAFSVQCFHEIKAVRPVMDVVALAGAPLLQLVERRDRNRSHFTDGAYDRRRALQRILSERCLQAPAPPPPQSPAKGAPAAGKGASKAWAPPGGPEPDAAARGAADAKTAPRFVTAVKALRCFPVLQRAETGREDPSALSEEILKAALWTLHIERKTSILLTCTAFSGKLLYKIRKRRSANVMKLFFEQVVLIKHFPQLIKNGFSCCRKIQRAVRSWLLAEKTKRQLVLLLFERCEQNMVRKSVSQGDLAAIKAELARVPSIRSNLERQTCERALAIMKDNYRRITRPKNAGDRRYQQQIFDMHKLPRQVLVSCSKHALRLRIESMRRELEDRRYNNEVHKRELQMWNDIDQAIQLIDKDGHNPAPRPELPPRGHIPYIVRSEYVLKMVLEANEWYTQMKHDSVMRGGDEAARNAKIDEVMLDIVRRAMFPKGPQEQRPPRRESKGPKEQRAPRRDSH